MNTTEMNSLQTFLTARLDKLATERPLKVLTGPTSTIKPEMVPGYLIQAQAAMATAVAQVKNGLDHCLQASFDLSVIVDGQFNIRDPGLCVLARNHPSGNFFRACEALKLKRRETEALGFAPSWAVISALRETSWDPIEVYNSLWKAAVQWRLGHAS